MFQELVTSIYMVESVIENKAFFCYNKKKMKREEEKHLTFEWVKIDTLTCYVCIASSFFVCSNVYT